LYYNSVTVPVTGKDYLLSRFSDKYKYGTLSGKSAIFVLKVINYFYGVNTNSLQLVSALF